MIKYGFKNENQMQEVLAWFKTVANISTIIYILFPLKALLP